MHMCPRTTARPPTHLHAHQQLASPISGVMTGSLDDVWARDAGRGVVDAGCAHVPKVHIYVSTSATPPHFPPRSHLHAHANFVGLDYGFNKEQCVYQRFLYDYVEQGLNRGLKELHLGRTAELVKSQIGALPTNMKLYAKHRKSVSNLLLKPIIQSISPSEFELRVPFKANYNN